MFYCVKTHHTFWDKMCFVMILASFRASVGAVCLVLYTFGCLFRSDIFCHFSGEPGNTGEQWDWGRGVPKTITSMTSLRARTYPEQVPRTQGPQGPIDKRPRQV